MRKKGLAGILSLLICIAIVGVGFASWVISGNATTPVEGSVVVDTITDNRVSLTISESSDKTVKFAGKSASSLSYEKVWLNTDSTEVEDLVITLNYSVAFKNVDNETSKSSITVNAEYDYSAIQGAIDAKYIAVKSEVKTNPDENGTGTITITFAWGEFFDKDGKEDTDLTDNLNPFDFYNKQKYSDELGTTAYNTLKALSNYNAKKIKITITASYTPAA